MTSPIPVFVLVFVTAASLTGCVATSTSEISSLKEDVAILQTRVAALQQGQADLSSKIDTAMNTNKSLGVELANTTSRVSDTERQMVDLNEYLRSRLAQSVRMPVYEPPVTAPVSPPMPSVAPETAPSADLSGPVDPAVPAGNTASVQAVTEPAAAVPSSGSSVLPPGAAAEMYRGAFSDYSAGKYDLASGGFHSYLQTSPRGEYAAQSHYYIGECHFSLGSWKDALDAYVLVEKGYPNSDTVPSAVLKQGLCLELLGRNTEARERFASVVSRFAGSPEAFTAQAKLNSRRRDAAQP